MRRDRFGKKKVISIDWAADFKGCFKMRTRGEEEEVIDRINEGGGELAMKFTRMRQHGGRNNQCSTCLILEAMNGLVKVKIYDKIAKFLQTDGRRERIACGFRHIVQRGVHHELIEKGGDSGIIRVEVQISLAMVRKEEEKAAQFLLGGDNCG